MFVNEKFVAISKFEESGIRETEGVCSKGRSGITRDYILSEFQPFLDIYNKRPEAENKGGNLVDQVRLLRI